MKNIKFIISLVLAICLASPSFAQFTRSIKNQQKRMANRTHVIAKKAKAAQTPKSNSRKIMTAYKKVWVLSSNGKRGYWRNPLAGELKRRLGQNAAYSNAVNFNHLKAYGKGPFGYLEPKPPSKFLDINKVRRSHENTDGLSKHITKSVTIGDKADGKPAIYYYNKIDLNLFMTAFNKDLIIVTDTLFVPAADKRKATLSSLWVIDRNYVKVIADCIVYESPIKLVSAKKTDFVFSANKFIFKSPYKNLKKDELNPPPPFYLPIDRTAKGYKDAMGQNEAKLLNRLYEYRLSKILTLLINEDDQNEVVENKLLAEYEHILKNKLNKKFLSRSNTLDYLSKRKVIAMNAFYIKRMKEKLLALNSVSDHWAKDKMYTDFENYRRNLIDVSVLSTNKKQLGNFNDLCNTFDSKYDNKDLIEVRKLEELGINILVEGEVNKLASAPFQYYPLPSKANLLPVNNQLTGEPTSLGFLISKTTGDETISLHLDVALDFDQNGISKAQQSLENHGITLESKIPGDFVSLEKQVLKINGQNLGYIIPLGNQNVRFEIKLTDKKLTLVKLFSSPIEFIMEYKIQGQFAPVSQKIILDIDPVINTIDPNAVLQSFSTIENSDLSTSVLVSSQIDPYLENREQTLNRMEVNLEVQFENQTKFYGPIRLSAAGTLASNEVLQILKLSEDFQIKVTGQAIYKFGKRDIIEFTTKENLITIDESRLK